MRKFHGTIASLALLLIIFGFETSQTAAARLLQTKSQAKKAAAKKADAPEFKNTPEGAYQAFVLAGITHDEKLLREKSLPDKELEILLTGEAPPKEALAEIRAAIGKLKFKRYKVGDEITLPDGAKMVVKPMQIDEDSLLIQAEGDPLPSRCEKVDGVWKIDPKPIIAAHKQAIDAAKKAAKKGDEAEKDAPKPKSKSAPKPPEAQPEG